MRNYKVTVAPELDIIALYPCYKLTLMPAKGLGPNSPPGRRYWISKENGVVMREERFWAEDAAAYFISQYDSFSTSQPPTLSLKVPAEVSKLKLAKGTATTMERFATVEAARAGGKSIYVPATIPAGFNTNCLSLVDRGFDSPATLAGICDKSRVSLESLAAGQRRSGEIEQPG